MKGCRLALALLFGAAVSMAQGQPIEPIDGFFEGFGQAATAISPDGGTVAGIGPRLPTGPTFSLFRAGEGTRVIDGGVAVTPYRTLGSAAPTRVLNGGAVVIGSAEFLADPLVTGFLTTGPRAFRWTPAAGFQDLGTLKTDNSGQSWAYGMSRDGQVIVGQADAELGPNGCVSTIVVGVLPGYCYGDRRARAFVWTPQSGMLDAGLGGLDETVLWGGRNIGLISSLETSALIDITPDGSLAVGWAGYESPNVSSEPIMWTRETGTTRIPGAPSFGTALAVSEDGSAIAGHFQHSPHRYGWLQSVWYLKDGVRRSPPLDGVVSDTSPNPPSSRFADMSEDGRVVVGTGFERVLVSDPQYAFPVSQVQQRGFHWVVGGSVTQIGTFRSDNGGDSIPYSTNADGSIVVGAAETDSGSMRGFLWRSRSGRLLDRENTLAQIHDSAAAQASAITMLSDGADFVLAQEIDVGAFAEVTRGARVARPPVAIRLGAALAHNTQAGDAEIGGLTVAAALSPSWTLGGYLGLGGHSNDLSGFDIESDLTSVGLWLRNRPRTAAGWTWKLALSGHGGSAEIDRPVDLAFTEAATGETDMFARAASLEIGFALRRGSWRLMPFAGLRHVHARRDGYTEKDTTDFPVTYDSYEHSASVAFLGLEADRAVGAMGWLTLRGGIEADLDRSANAVQGTSQIPGMEAFSVPSPVIEHSVRGTASVRYEHPLGPGDADIGVGLRHSAYVGQPTLFATIGYTVQF